MVRLVWCRHVCDTEFCASDPLSSQCLLFKEQCSLTVFICLSSVDQKNDFRQSVFFGCAENVFVKPCHFTMPVFEGGKWQTRAVFCSLSVAPPPGDGTVLPAVVACLSKAH